MASPQEKKPEIGALWERTSQAGNKFLSGKVVVDGKDVEIIIFANTYKKPGETSPDWRIYASEPRQAGGASTPAPKAAAADKPKASKPAKADAEPVGEDDIPF